MRRRMAAMLLSLLMLVTAHAENAPEKDADWFAPLLHANGSMMYLLTEAQLDVIAALSSEEIHAVVEAMFLAAAGVKEREEISLWKTYRTEAEKDARRTENAAYRALTLPWLEAVFAPGSRSLSSAVQREQEAAELLLQENAEAEPKWQPSESFAALEGNVYGQAYLAQLAELGGEGAERCLAVSQAVMQRWLAEIDHDALRDTNRHYECWIYAPDSPIDYPVVQGNDNAYYLDRMFNRKENPSGTLFIDYRNLSDFRDPNTMIYGHHMRDGSMFHSLTEYDTEGYFDAHPFMVVISHDTIWLVEVFAGYITDSSDHCYDIAISGEKDMQRFTDAAIQKSYFDARLTIDVQKDHLVTLSTCAYNFDNARCVVIGRLNAVWERAE